MLKYNITNNIFCNHHKLEKKWEYNEPVQQQFIDFKKTYDSDKREVLYYILTEFGVPMKVVRLNKYVLEPVVKSLWVNICMINFIFKMVYNKKMLYRHCFSTLL
jgi:hypothetical protein